MDRLVLGEIGSINFAVVDGLVHGPAMETFEEVDRNGESAFDECRMLEATLRGGFLLRDRENTELSHSPTHNDYGAQAF